MAQKPKDKNQSIAWYGTDKKRWFFLQIIFPEIWFHFQVICSKVFLLNSVNGNTFTKQLSGIPLHGELCEAEPTGNQKWVQKSFYQPYQQWSAKRRQTSRCKNHEAKVTCFTRIVGWLCATSRLLLHYEFVTSKIRVCFVNSIDWASS